MSSYSVGIYLVNSVCILFFFTVFQTLIFWSSIRFLLGAGMIVFLNKQDTLKEKVESGKSIAKYFPEYSRYEMNSKG